MAELTHFNVQGRARMVDVSEKPVTHRTAVAAGAVFMVSDTLSRIREGRIKKGDVLAVAQVAGILAAILPGRRAARIDMLRAITTE